MELQIRPAQADDAPAISRLVQGLAHHFLLDPAQAATSPFLQTVSPAAIAGYIASDAFDYCVGECQGQLAGVVAVRDGQHLFHLFVDTAFQRLGFVATGVEVQTRGIAYVPMRLFAVVGCKNGL